MIAVCRCLRNKQKQQLSGWCIVAVVRQSEKRRSIHRTTWQAQRGETVLHITLHLEKLPPMARQARAPDP